MGKRIVGYVISHSGKPGGPWECDHGPRGQATNIAKYRAVYSVEAAGVARWSAEMIRKVHPAARILRLVRRERHTAEERAVVESALRVPSDARDEPQYWLALSNLDDACAALRAKRGGK